LLLRQFLGNRRLLVAVAAPIELRAVLDALKTGPTTPLPPLWSLVEAAPQVDVLHTGVSKANAAGALARVLDPARHAAVVNLGIAGALPGAAPLRVGETIVADRSDFADEGLLTPQGYRDIASIGFPLTPSGVSHIACDPQLVELFRPHATRVGRIATVSLCSATDAQAQEIARRTDALAESMEGAAFALVAAQLGVAFVECRAISNLTGDRATQAWNIPAALQSLQALLAQVHKR
jgi:futalosine hydrolase